MSQKYHSEKFAIQFQSAEPKYYTRMPDILFHMRQKGKRLSLGAQQLYRTIKHVAGDTGKCWMTAENLSSLAGISQGATTKFKRELCQSFDQLAGNALIHIESKSKGRQIYHEITVIDIWKYNNEFMSTFYQEKAMNKNVHNHSTSSPNEPVKSTSSPNEPVVGVTSSPGERNKIPKQKDTFVKEQHTSAKAPTVVFSNQENNLFPPEAQGRIIEWFKQRGASRKTCEGFVSLIDSEEDFMKALDYMETQRKKNKAKGSESFRSPIAYLRTVLKNRYWEKKIPKI